MYPLSVSFERQSNIRIELENEQATAGLATALSGIAGAGDVIALKGDLGAGKTAFARAFIRALCGPDTEVPSPTFTLVQSYDSKSGGSLFHFDLYRLESPEEALQLDIDDAFAEGISLIEWPEKLGGLLPRGHLEVALAYGNSENQRVCVITGDDAWNARLAGVSL
jgi:tRNA threonylcarbamoyladenosine biosynthesis protein TsaE